MRQPCMVRRCASQVNMRLRRTWCRKRCCCCGQSATGLEASPMLQAMPSACCTMCSVRRYGAEALRPPTSARHAMPRLRPKATSRTYSFLFRNFQNQGVRYCACATSRSFLTMRLHDLSACRRATSVCTSAAHGACCGNFGNGKYDRNE